jgi:hypothetical protein
MEPDVWEALGDLSKARPQGWSIAALIQYACEYLLAHKERVFSKAAFQRCAAASFACAWDAGEFTLNRAGGDR